MPRAKISEFSTTAGDNTDIDGINIAEGCAPSGINDAIRELMAQLKDFQSGAAGDNITVVGTLAAKGTSASGADLKLYEDTDNGTNYVGFIAPASIASNVQWTLPSADGSSGQALQTNGSGTLSFATLGISAGGTGQTTANAAFNALAPSQTGNSGRYLTTDGTNTSWGVNPLGTVTSVAMSVPSFLSVSGSPITSSGTLAVSLSGTALPTANGGTGLTSFTANGVVYASSTSALTTGSALTFDGTNLVNTSSAVGTPEIAIANSATSAGSNARLRLKTGVSGASTLGDAFVQFTDSLNWNWAIGAGSSTSNALTFNQYFGLGSNELMRLTSTGLGIGTSSPAYKLDVNGTINATTTVGMSITSSGSATFKYFSSGSATPYYTYLDTSRNFIWQDNSTERMRLDSSGNLGLGVTPSAWQSSLRAFQVGATASIYSNGSNTTFHGLNFFTDSGGTNRYLTSNFASAYGQVSGAHQWYTAPSGTAGNAISFTQAMTLDASGNLGVGTTSPTARINVYNSGSGDAAVRIGNAQNALTTDVGKQGSTSYGATSAGDSFLYTNGTLSIMADNGGGVIKFSAGGNTERARITSGGNFGIGTTNPNSRLDVDANTAANTTVLSLTNSANWGWGIFLDFRTPLTNGGAVGLAGRISSLYESSNNFALAFGTTGSGTNTERARITSGGRLLVGTTTENTSGGVLQVSNGITFPATQSASSDANTLDDYEEGTWTPNQGGGLTVTGAFSSSGVYTKIGRLVTVRGTVQGATNVAVAGGGIICSNLPFASTSAFPNFDVGSASNNVPSAGTQVIAASSSVYAATAIAATSSISFTLTYNV